MQIKTIEQNLHKQANNFKAEYNIPFCRLLRALEIVSGLVGRLYSMFGSGDPGEQGEQGSLCRRLPDKLSILKEIVQRSISAKLSMIICRLTQHADGWQ